jgi:hypothetical protein
LDPTFRRVALIAATLGLLVSLFIALRPGGDDDETAPPTTTAQTTTAEVTTETTTTTETEPPPPPPPPPRPTVVRVPLRVVGGQPVPGIRRPKVKQGRQVVIVTTADVTDHIHLHGYDLMADVAPGSPGTIRFTADAPGRFEIELEDRGLPIGELEVRP